MNWSIKELIKSGLIVITTMSTIFTVFYLVTGMALVIQKTINQTINNPLVFNTCIAIGSFVISIYVSLKSIDYVFFNDRMKVKVSA